MYINFLIVKLNDISSAEKKPERETKETKIENKADRQEMPPPPSPASSTCSEPASSPLPPQSKFPCSLFISVKFYDFL